ncbi:hypothetical protein AAL_06895 [Moelleriella libera RCEF 2490]|uniref:Uncharacterized protein n=1 Tax=Moelleriella libera RCEF 2490 TaxID=1081109 RepID=A0A167YCG2_9HYPO|nr:hypothetical protein AAL_06895 [Moelleriella libera RCEF 2490]
MDIKECSLSPVFLSLPTRLVLITCCKAFWDKIGGKTAVHAVDDGGIQLYDLPNCQYFQVAMLEGKKSFQKIVDGEASVTDENLGQLVGEALALALQSEAKSVKQGASHTDFVIILATTHYMRFFHFHISPGYLASYQSIVKGTPDAELADCLRVNSTPWLDIKEAKHRKLIATFLLALVHWANQVIQ